MVVTNPDGFDDDGPSARISVAIKPEFWRIQNIAKHAESPARRWLQEQVADVEVAEGEGFSLAADDSRTLCATLTSFTRPAPPDRSWRVDQNFYGCTPLYDPGDAEVDVVAITGLGGHALGSFRSTDGTCVWLRDFAPLDLPRARIVTYGYDTVLAGNHSTEGIEELAQTLLDSLAWFRRRTQTEQRPICFVCHSLGGVVAKQALVRASKATATEPRHRALHQILASTYGLVLMGVPNLGLRHDTLTTIVRGRPNQRLIAALVVDSDGEPSHFLSYLTNEFAELDRRRESPFEIVSYYETMASPTAQEVPGSNKFELLGPRVLMVSRISAERVGHLARYIDHWSSHTDHRGLVRFENSHDMRYRSLIEKLYYMTEEAGARPQAAILPQQQRADTERPNTPNAAPANPDLVQTGRFDMINLLKVLDGPSEGRSTSPWQRQDLPLKMKASASDGGIMDYRVTQIVRFIDPTTGRDRFMLRKEVSTRYTPWNNVAFTRVAHGEDIHALRRLQYKIVEIPIAIPRRGREPWLEELRGGGDESVAETTQLRRFMIFGWPKEEPTTIWALAIKTYNGTGATNQIPWQHSIIWSSDLSRKVIIPIDERSPSRRLMKPSLHAVMSSTNTVLEPTSMLDYCDEWTFDVLDIQYLSRHVIGRLHDDYISTFISQYVEVSRELERSQSESLGVLDNANMKAFTIDEVSAVFQRLQHYAETNALRWPLQHPVTESQLERMAKDPIGRQKVVNKIAQTLRTQNKDDQPLFDESRPPPLMRDIVGQNSPR